MEKLLRRLEDYVGMKLDRETAEDCILRASNPTSNLDTIDERFLPFIIDRAGRRYKSILKLNNPTE